MLEECSISIIEIDLPRANTVRGIFCHATRKMDIVLARMDI